MTQADAFWTSEGDAWFRRNRHALNDRAANDRVLAIIKRNGVSPQKIIEIGASNGFRLEALHRTYGAATVAIEPSEEAIADGRSQYPHVEFLRGRADALPAGGGFDLAIVHFVLHWIDRELLLRAVAEIDRVVSAHGYVVIGDFLPDVATKVRYHHLPEREVYTFKQDYPRLFTATGLYAEVDRVVFSDTGDESDPLHRCVVALLRKGLDDSYATRVLER